MKAIRRRRFPVALDSPDPIDVHVGSRIRLRRTLLGISQEKLAEAVELTFQQVQKYEKGANRVSASRLWDLSRVLDVPVAWFFEEMPEVFARRARKDRMKVRGPVLEDANDLGRRETLELVLAYYRIIDPAVRHQVAMLIKTMAPKKAA